MKKYIAISLILISLLQGCTQIVSHEQLNSSPSYSNETGRNSTNQISCSTTISVESTIVSTTTSTNPTTNSATGSTSSMPPISLAIRNDDEYENLLLAARDERVYQADSMYRMVFVTHEELAAFVKLLNNLPIPSIADAKSITFRYYPNIAQIRIEYVVKQTHFYRYTYILDKGDEEANRRTLLEQKQTLDKEINVNKDMDIKAITQFKIRWEDSKVYRGWLDMAGWLVMVEIRNDNMDMSSKSITELFEPMTIKNKLQFPAEDSAALPTAVPPASPSAVQTTPTVTITLPGTLVSMFPTETSNPRTS